MAAEPLRLHRPGAAIEPATAAMALTVNPDAMRPLITATVAEVLRQLESDSAAIPADGPLCFDEPTAAGLLGLEPHVLRDERLRHRIQASQIVGRRIRYTRADLLAYLAGRRIEASV